MSNPRQKTLYLQALAVGALAEVAKLRLQIPGVLFRAPAVHAPRLVETMDGDSCAFLLTLTEGGYGVRGLVLLQHGLTKAFVAIDSQYTPNSPTPLAVFDHLQKHELGEQVSLRD